MIIREIKIENFRGFHQEIRISFDDKPFILMSAPNGIGKTSVIDAIEWCLTGTIGRLKRAYDNRSTNTVERKKNLGGILKNKNAKAKEFVKVELSFIDENNLQYNLVRKQEKDALEPQSSTVEINGDRKKAEEWLQKNIGKNFYQYHFCDVQKSFEMQNRKREALPEMFESFISDYSTEKIIAKNLELYSEDVQRSIDDLKSESKEYEDQIKSYEKQLDKYKEEIQIIQYPSIEYWKGEELDITRLSQEELLNQFSNLQSFGYDVAHSLVEKIVSDLENKKTVNRLIGIKRKVESFGDRISYAISLGLDKDSNVIETITSRISEYEKLHLSKDNYRKYHDILVNRRNGISLEEYNISIASIEGKEKQINELDKEIDHLSKGNAVLGIFANLLSHREEIVKYRDERKKCPICGSETFSLINESEVLLEADTYIQENSEIVAKKSNKKKELADKVEKEYEDLLSKLARSLEEIKIELKNQLFEYEQLKKETTAFFTERNALITLLGEQISPNQLISQEGLETIISSFKASFLQESEIALYRKEYKSILTILDDKNEGEEEQVTAERLKNFSKESDYIERYDSKTYSEKFNSIRSLLNNREYLELSASLKASKEKVDEITNKSNSLSELMKVADNRSQDIEKLVERLEKEEYAAVGPNLRKYYKKLARIDSIKSIDLLLEEDQISIVDEKKKNVVNILSNGQLGVFMLSYFFAGITTRNKSEHCKIFFLDDLTSCMDDINMLAFLDLLKYEMTSKDKNMEQIFFVTCEEKICKLLRYKLEGCDIPYRELTEKDFTIKEIKG